MSPDARFYQVKRKSGRVAAFAWRHVDHNNIISTWFRMLQLIVVLGAPLLWLLHEVEEVLMRVSQTIPFGTRHSVGLVPDHVVAQYPASALHLDRKARRNQQELLPLSNAAERGLPPAALLGSQQNLREVGDSHSG